jgi:ATP-dependent Clp protease protease subunit
LKKKFWNWVRNEDTGARTLVLNGQISDETWYGDEVTPGLFREELNAGEGDITVWINSPGGDVFAAAQIYNMLKEYSGKVEVRIDGMAASAASVVAMAGDKVSMSPVAMMMIHNPMTVAMGDHKAFQQAMDMLEEVKESIINAYELRTGLSRARISHLMDSETWMNANRPLSLVSQTACSRMRRLRQKCPPSSFPTGPWRWPSSTRLPRKPGRKSRFPVAAPSTN